MIEPTKIAVVIELPKPESKGDPNLPKILRDLADKVERGEVVDYIAAYVDNSNGGRYTTEVSTSISDSIVLSSLLWQTCVDKLRRPR